MFVLGCPRSGTTLLQAMLHSHPRIAIPPENRFVLPAYWQRGRFGSLAEPANRRALAEWIVDRRESKFRDFGVDRDAVVAAIVDGPPTLGSALAAVFEAFAARFDKPRWGDKRPAYYQDVGAIRRLFPDAQFVHLVRDGRSCVASLKRVPWWDLGTDAALATWTEAIDYGRAAARRLPPGTWHELTFERLVTDPEPELRGLCSFLGEEYDGAMLHPQQVAAQVAPPRKHWHQRLEGALDPGRITSWSDGLEPAERDLIQYVAGERLARYGYDPDPAAGSPDAASVRRFRRVQMLRRLAQRKRHVKDRIRDLRHPQQLASRR